MRPLVLVGGGGHCKSVIEAAESAGFEIKGVLDMPQYVGKDILAYNYIGTDDDMAKYASTCDFIVTMGFIKDPSLRIKLHEKVKTAGGHFATVIASTATVSKYATVGEGTVILHHATVNADAKIGFGCIINTAANIEHDAVIGDYCHISTGAMVNGEAKVGERTFVGSNATLKNGVTICPNCVVAAGLVIYQNIMTQGIIKRLGGG